LKKEEPVTVINKQIEKIIVHPSVPDKMIMKNIEWKVLTQETVDELGDSVYYILSTDDYENLSSNMAEIKRFLKEQKNIIIYYRELK